MEPKTWNMIKSGTILSCENKMNMYKLLGKKKIKDKIIEYCLRSCPFKMEGRNGRKSKTWCEIMVIMTQ